MHVMSGFGDKVMTFSDLAITLKSSRSNPQHLETNFVPFHTIFNIYSHTQSFNENKLTPMCYLLNIGYLGTLYILWQKSMIVSLFYPYMMQLSLYIRFIYIELVVLNF